MQFPVKIPEGLRKPYFAMGESGKSVTIWHWRDYNESLQTKESESEGDDLESANDGGTNITEQKEAEEHQEKELKTEDVQEEKAVEKVKEKAKENYKDFVTVKEMNAKGFKKSC